MITVNPCKLKVFYVWSSEEATWGYNWLIENVSFEFVVKLIFDLIIGLGEEKLQCSG